MWKLGIVIALSSLFVASTALAQAPGSGSGGGSGGSSPGSSSPGTGSPGGTPGTTGASPGGGSSTPGASGASESSPGMSTPGRDVSNPCPAGQSQESPGQPCTPTRNMPGSQSKSMDRTKSMDRSRSMEKADKRIGSGAPNGRVASKQSVKSVQEALKDKGYDPGAIDGTMGPRTSEALRDFQKAEGLQATGRVDSETRSKLGIQ